MHMLRYILVGVLPFSLMACYPALSGETDPDSLTGLTDSSSSESSPPTTGGPSCGDGLVDPGEMCDDGNKNEADACLNNCMPASCGDGKVQAGVETCDDGNKDETDTCLNNCTPAGCGDGQIQAGVEYCDGESPTCDADCTMAECGDGVVNMLAGESCDVESESPTCNDDCTAVMCGDSKINVMAGEVCDNGANVDAPYSMTMPPPGACTAQCQTVKYCGDGEAQDEEACDDGNDINNDECSNMCILPVCGDGIIQGGEECDDKNLTDDDGCSNACVVARYIFVSSATYTGSLGGVAGGNDKCKALADTSDGLKGKVWRAWLSDGALSLKDDIKSFEGWYRLPDGFPVAKGASELFSGSLTNSISVDEKGAMQVSVPVWTGTTAGGLAQMDTCNKWSSASDVIGGAYGDSGKKDSNWTEKKLGNVSQSLGCNITTAHIYCVQIEG